MFGLNSTVREFIFVKKDIDIYLIMNCSKVILAIILWYNYFEREILRSIYCMNFSVIAGLVQ